VETVKALLNLHEVGREHPLDAVEFSDPLRA
jgi:hypothetical protein